jgi:hypothetical protein
MKTPQQIFDDICEIKDAHLYFTDEEIETDYLHFLADIETKNVQTYIDNLKTEIEERKPEKHGCYDLEYERFIESVIAELEKYK